MTCLAPSSRRTAASSAGINPDSSAKERVTMAVAVIAIWHPRKTLPWRLRLPASEPPGMGSHSFPKYGLPPYSVAVFRTRRAGRRGPDAGRRRRGQHVPPAGPAAGLLDATRAAFTSGLQVTAVIFAALAQAFSQVIADPSYRRSGWLRAADGGAPAGSCSARTGHPHCAVADTNGSSRRETRRYAASYPAAEPSHGVPQSLHPH